MFCYRKEDLNGVADHETDAREDLLVVVVQASLDSVIDVDGHVLAVPVPVDGPGAGLSSVHGARRSDEVVASGGDVSGEVDGLVQLDLVGSTEDQAAAGGEVLHVIGCQWERKGSDQSDSCWAQEILCFL